MTRATCWLGASLLVAIASMVLQWSRYHQRLTALEARIEEFKEMYRDNARSDIVKIRNQTAEWEAHLAKDKWDADFEAEMLRDCRRDLEKAELGHKR